MIFKILKEKAPRKGLGEAFSLSRGAVSLAGGSDLLLSLLLLLPILEDLLPCAGLNFRMAPAQVAPELPARFPEITAP